MSEKDSACWERNARWYDRATLLLNTSFSDMAQAVADAVTGAGDVLELAAGTGLVTVRWPWLKQSGVVGYVG